MVKTTTKELPARRVRCSAHRTNGEPCRRWAIKGGTVCYMHGGAAAQVKRTARERLDRMVDPALDLLGEILKKGADGRHAMRAIVAVLDRCGFPASHNVAIQDPYQAKAALARMLGVEPGQLPEE